MIKAIIFDNDGVLINSTRVGMKKHIKVAKEIGLKIPIIKLQRKHWGKIWETDFLNSLASELSWTKVETENFKKLYQQQYYLIHYPTFNGLASVLADLKKQNFLLTIMSNRDKKSLLRRLKLADIEHSLFSFIQSYKDHSFIKPDPRVFDFLLKEFEKIGIHISQVLFVGDTVKYDFQTAISHEPPIKFVGITSGVNTKKDFIKAGLDPKLILKSPSDLSKILKML